MLTFIHSPEFKKRFQTLSEKLKRKTLERLDLFSKDEFNVILNNHNLHGEYIDCRSINIAGDLRLIYKRIDKNSCRLVNMGTHNQLYG